VLVCLYEDRPHQLPGVKLLVLSLSRYCPKWPVRLFVPDADSSIRAWFRKFSQVELVLSKPEAGGSFNVKPTILIQALASGEPECLWIDTDVLVNRDPSYLFCVSPETIVVTQDPWEYEDGSTHRAATWHLKHGRSLPGPLNSAVVRVTQHHLPLIQAWRDILRRDWYLRMQALPVRERDQHALSDQDAISALLASEVFSSIPVKRMRHPTEILQHHGAGAYSLKERLQTLWGGLPPLIHAMGSVKPWQMKPRPSPLQDLRTYYERYYLELSPYLHAARRYRMELGEEYEWLNISTGLGRMSHLTALGSPSVQGIWQATLHRWAWNLRHAR
jgi:hypothetical protein